MLRFGIWLQIIFGDRTICLCFVVCLLCPNHILAQTAYEKVSFLCVYYKGFNTSNTQPVIQIFCIFTSGFTKNYIKYHSLKKAPKRQTLPI